MGSLPCIGADIERSRRKPIVKGSLWVVQNLCVVWLVLVVLSPCVLGGCESAEG
jgi:hypothetical protein